MLQMPRQLKGLYKNCYNHAWHYIYDLNIMSLMLPVEQILGAEKVIAALGYWPKFHDAEIILFSAARALPFKTGDTMGHLNLNVRQYISVGEGTAQYEQILSKSVLIRFIFNEIRDIEISGFNHQNVIDSITFSRIQINDRANIVVEIESIFGLGGSLCCSAVAVEVDDLLKNI
jgi:Immunity protein 50